MSSTTSLSALIDDLVDANHILFHQGVVDAFGHVSVRHPDRPDRFLISRNLAPVQVTAADIMEFDLDGTSIGGTGHKPYLERFIHGEIYRARPDVMAVVHSHSPSVVPFSVVPSQPLRPICHMCGFLGRGARNFEIREKHGDATDLLIRTSEMGRSLAEALGRDAIVLMRGHGSTTVGPSLEIAVYRAVYAEINARLLSDALRLGPVEYLTLDEADTALAIEKEVARPWRLWKAAASEGRTSRP